MVSRVKIIKITINNFNTYKNQIHLIKRQINLSEASNIALHGFKHREKRDNMHITNIKIKNLKTFKDVSLDLNRFNVIIGANGCGKTNFIEIFELLKDISQNFHDAVKKHCGIYVKNLNTDEDSYLKCRFEKQNVEQPRLIEGEDS